MENRTPAAAPMARGRKAWMLVAVLAVVVVGLGWWWMGDSSGSASPRLAAGAVATGGVVDDAPLPGAARIVDAPPSAMAGVVAGGQMPGPGAAPTVGSEAPASALQSMMADAASDPTPPPDPFAGVLASAEPARPPATRVAPPRRSSSSSQRDGDNDLLSTLLHNIETDKSSAAAKAASLDALVQRLSDDDAPSVRRRSEQIQSNLRDCPAPNTAAGLKCRQEICAVYAGRDPACPALN